MTDAALARAGYDRSTKSTASPRAIEFQVFARCTAELAAAEKKKTNDYPAYVKALSDNLRLWTILGVSVASEQNALSQETRGLIFNLFEFTRSQTNKIIGGDKSISADALVDINRNVMAGLRTSVIAETDAVAAGTPA